MNLLNHKYRAVTVLLLSLLASGAVFAFAGVSQKQVRKAITRMVGFNLPGDAVRVLSLSESSTDTIEATAELELVFHVVQNAKGEWQVREIRAGQDRWEPISLFARALQTGPQGSSCATLGVRGSTDLSVRQARCLVADLFGVALPSDAVRIKEISPFVLPVATESSTLVVTYFQGEFRLKKIAGNLEVTEFKSGSRPWTSLAGLTGEVDVAKRSQATVELNQIAAALRHYRSDHGSYVLGDKHSVLIDHLSPRYLSRVVRLDPWHRPYHYQGERDHFTLRSAGPDGKENTADDVSVSENAP